LATRIFSLDGALARARRPHPTVRQRRHATLRKLIRTEVRRILADELPEAVAYLTRNREEYRTNGMPATGR
jgi:hypothetical protein